MTTSPLKADELCLIMKQCKDSGVSKLTLGKLCLEFFQPDSQRNVELPTAPTIPAGPPLNLQDVSVENSTAVLQSQVLEEDEERALLLIDSPEDFERRMIEEDLEYNRQNLVEVNRANEENNRGARTDLQ